MSAVAARPATLAFEDVEAGAKLPSISLEITHKRVCMNAAATWDWFPGHHDPEYARRQGQRTIYLSTLFFQGFVDRLVTDWAGPDAFIRRRRIRMLRSIYAGQTATARGRVTGKREQGGRALVEIEAVVESEEGACVPAEVDVELPRRRGGA
jgi:acyl dehydratase